jgi:probable Rubsico expression protein CbbX
VASRVDVEKVTEGEGLQIDIGAALRESNVQGILDELDRDLIGLVAVKTRIREVASLLLIERLRKQAGLEAEPPVLHMCFTGGPGTGKTTVGLRMARILHALGYIREGQLVIATRDDLVGQYVGHTAPKTKEVLKRAMGGVLFIDEAYYLYRPENDRDYGQEAIEMMLHVMEERRGDLVVILAGYHDRMETFFQSNPGFRSRIAHHLDFPDYSLAELMAIADLMMGRQMYTLGTDARTVFAECLGRRVEQPHFANARSIRNAIDRIKLRQADRLVRQGGCVTRDELARIDPSDIRQSRAFEDGAPDRSKTP